MLFVGPTLPHVGPTKGHSALKHCANVILPTLGQQSVLHWANVVPTYTCYLGIACSVVQPGRALLWRMINMTMHVSNAQTHLFLTNEAKEDVKMWLNFLSNFNGKCIFLNETFLLSYTLELHTDAAQYLGYAGMYKDKRFYGAFPLEWQKLNIMTLEFLSNYSGIIYFGSLVEKSFHLFTDNEAFVSVINKQTSRVSEVIRMVRYMVLQCLNLNILFKAKHIPGKKNILADCISRLQVNQFFKLAAHAQKEPNHLPNQLLPQNFWSALGS